MGATTDRSESASSFSTTALSASSLLSTSNSKAFIHCKKVCNPPNEPLTSRATETCDSQGLAMDLAEVQPSDSILIVCCSAGIASVQMPVEALLFSTVRSAASAHQKPQPPDSAAPERSDLGTPCQRARHRQGRLHRRRREAALGKMKRQLDRLPRVGQKTRRTISPIAVDHAP